MTNQSWFYAANGQQQGPFPEAQLRDLITRGTVQADTLVWTEGMSGWQRAGEIPGLVPGGSGPPAISQTGGPPPMNGGYGGGALSIDLPLLPLLGWTIVYVIGFLLVIPAPWVATSYYRWMASRTSVPGRPNFAFDGKVGDIWYVFVVLALMNYAGQLNNYLPVVAILIEGFLSWMIVRWIAGNLSSNGQPLPIAFNGSVVTHVGWYVLMFVSFITIIGWAWVIAAWIRWICRNVAGTRREIIFNGSGLEVLWRTLVFSIGCAFIIPIPWVLRWYTTWYASQFALVERGYAAA